MKIFYGTIIAGRFIVKARITVPDMLSLLYADIYGKMGTGDMGSEHRRISVYKNMQPE